MAIEEYFLDDVEGNRHEYDMQDFSRFHDILLGGNGFSNKEDTDNMKYEVSEDMKGKVGSGYAVYKGYAVRLTSPETVEHESADPDQDRIDMVVVRFKFNPEEAKFTVDVVTGSPDSSPKAPKLTQDSDEYEMAIAEVLVKADESTLKEDNVTDMRKGNYIPIDNLQRSVITDEDGSVNMPNQSYVEMYDKKTIKLPPHDVDKDDSTYSYKDIPFNPDIDRQKEIQDGKFVAKQDGAYTFTVHTRLEERLPDDDLQKFEISLVINGKDKKDDPIGRRDDNVERFFNTYGPTTQETGMVTIFLEKGDKAELKAGIRNMPDGAELAYVRSTISKAN